MSAQVGLRDLHYALLESDTETEVKYKTPVKIAGAINAKISPKSNTETLYCDDGPSETASSLGEITVELEIKNLTLATLSALLGHKVYAGAIIMKDDDMAPYAALGFKSKKSNGKYRFIWLYKGRFSLPEQEYATQEDKPNFQTGKIQGTFIKRAFDNAWQVMGDEDEDDFQDSSVWFSEVYEIDDSEEI